MVRCLRAGTVGRTEKICTTVAICFAEGADYFILGCTELPIVADTLPEDGPFIDPTAELAKAAIRFCGYETTQD